MRQQQFWASFSKQVRFLVSRQEVKKRPLRTSSKLLRISRLENEKVLLHPTSFKFTCEEADHWFLPRVELVGRGVKAKGMVMGSRSGGSFAGDFNVDGVH